MYPFSVCQSIYMYPVYWSSMIILNNLAADIYSTSLSTAIKYGDQFGQWDVDLPRHDLEDEVLINLWHRDCGTLCYDSRDAILTVPNYGAIESMNTHTTETCSICVFSHVGHSGTWSKVSWVWSYLGRLSINKQCNWTERCKWLRNNVYISPVPG